MPAALSADIKAEAIRLAVEEGLTCWQIHKQLNVNLSTVRNWLGRANVPETMNLVNRAVRSAVNREVEKLKDSSGEARFALAQGLVDQATQVGKVRIRSVSQLANEGQGLASVTKTIAETCAVVFGWNQEKPVQGHMHLHAALDAVIEEPIIVDQSVNNPVEPTTGSGVGDITLPS